MDFKKHLIYISHPYGGKVENEIETAEIVQRLYMNDELYDNCCFVSPIHCFSFMYHNTEYYKGLSFCTDLLKHCKLMLLCGDWKSSVGCTAEKEICDELNIPYIEVKDMEALDKLIESGDILNYIK